MKKAPKNVFSGLKSLKSAIKTKNLCRAYMSG